MSTLYELTGDWITAHALIESGEYSPDDLKDTLDAIECSIEDKADGYGKLIRNSEASVTAIDKEIARLTARKKAAERSIDFLRSRMMQAMDATGKEKIKTAMFTWYKAAGKESVEVFDPQVFTAWAQSNHDDLLRFKDPEPDKAKILDAINAGTEIPGVKKRQEASVSLR
jgi:Mg2+ and Co2+ transporter CorA